MSLRDLVSTGASSPVQQRVLIVGGGIAGHVAALLLKQKGWQPVILEKVNKVGASGLALVLQSNGLKVLNKAGVVDVALEDTLPWKHWNDWSSSGEFLGGPGSESAGEFANRYGWPAIGLSRTKLQLGLKDRIVEAGIVFQEGWKLKDIRVGPESVTAVSEDGREIEGAFLIGADGLKSVTRDVIFARHGHKDVDASFTGIEVIGGLSPSPQFLKDHQGLNLFWGATETIITHPIENGIHIWGATVPVDGITQESWRTLGPGEMESEKQRFSARWANWHPVITELVSTATKMQNIGLYDRGVLEENHWHHDRILLIGDAAHPTTPHAGQGANQCIEDAWALFNKVPTFDADRPISTSELKQVFQSVAAERQPRTTGVMRKALQAGEDRVLRGDRANEEGEKARNESLKKKWNDLEAIRAEQDDFLKPPFEDAGGFRRWLESRGGKM